MSYINATDVLPKELIEIIQQYVSGKTLYIPCKEKKNWGSESKIKQYYKIFFHRLLPNKSSLFSFKIKVFLVSISDK